MGVKLIVKLVGVILHAECMSVDASNIIPCSYPICEIVHSNYFHLRN